MNNTPQLAPVNAATGLVMEPKLNSLAAPPEGVDSETAWEQVLARDAQARFYYGVTTTASSAGRAAPAAGRCARTCASFVRQPLRKLPAFAPASVAAQLR